MQTARAATPAALLEAAPQPVFKAGHTLPPLTRWGWTLPFEARVALADHWGYALEFGGYATTNLVRKLDDPNSTESRICALTASDPARYPLCVLLHRPLIDSAFINSLPTETWCHDAGGNLITNVPQWKRYSPEMPASVYRDAAAGSTGTLARILQVCPISVVLNGGEYGLSVYGHSGTTWAQDPAVVAARGARTWFDYVSERKTRLELYISEAVRARVPELNLYLFYTTGGAPLRSSAPGAGWWTWVWDYAWFQPISDLPNSSRYYRDFNSGWSGNQDLLSCALNSAAQEIAQGRPLSYNWVCGGYQDGAFSELDRYLGFLKCNYTAGMIGGIAGYFSYPPGGFGADFGESPPHWLLQMMALGHCHALFSALEDFLRNGDLLPGPNPHRWSADLPACEFPTGDPDLRVLVRRHRAREAWILTAWAAAGEARETVVTIPDLGEVTLLARPAGSVYRARRTDDGPSLRLLDPDPLDPSRNLRTLILAHPVTGSTRFTNTNVVEIASLPMMDGYDGYRITASDQEPIDGWLPYDPDASPQGLTAEFPEPATEGPVRLFAWFRDSNPDNPLSTTAVAGEIVFTRAAPLPVAHAQHSSQRLGGQSVIVPAADIDAGSTGGAHAGEPLAIYRSWLTLTDGPAPDLLPDDDTRVMVAETGTYTLVLSVMNEADSRWFTESLANLRGWCHVPGFTNWSPASLTLTNSHVGFTAPDFQLAVAGAVRGSGDRMLGFQSNATVVVGGDLDASLTFEMGGRCAIGGDLRVPVTAWNNYHSRTLAADIATDGDLVLEGVWRFTSAPTNGAVGHGSLLEADGDMTLGQTAQLHLNASATNGGSARLRMANLTVAAGAVINADGGGFGGLLNADGYGPGRGRRHVTRGGGGGYGGRGGIGNTLASPMGAAGGSNGLAYAPLVPGSAGGGRGPAGAQPGDPGGGLVCIEARGSVTVDGTITANGANVQSYAGAGSGGGIFIRAARFAGGTLGTLRANGGAYGSQAGGAGGGGRIAVWHGAIGREEAARLLSGAQDELGPRLSVTTSLATFTGSATASRGSGTDTGQRDGTVCFLSLRPRLDTVLTVR
jgi:hypothetical protein